MIRGFGDGARLARQSYRLVRRDKTLLWFPVLSGLSLAATAGFWLYEGAWLYAIRANPLLYAPLVATALYSLGFVGIFFQVALAATAADALQGRTPSLGAGVRVACSRLSPIAGWAGYSIFAGFAIATAGAISKWLGRAAQLAWSLATFFVVPAIALEDCDSATARSRSFDIARTNWQAEVGGRGAIAAAVAVPGLCCYVAAKLLAKGYVHDDAGRIGLGLVVLAGFLFFAAVRVVVQVLAVSLYLEIVQPESIKHPAPPHAIVIRDVFG